MRGRLILGGVDPDGLSISDHLDVTVALALESPGGMVDAFKYREHVAEFLFGATASGSKASDLDQAKSELDKMRAQIAERQAQSTDTD